jgi:hypothetical protein
MNQNDGVIISWVGSGITFLTIPVNEYISAVSGLMTIALTAILIYKAIYELKSKKK